MSMHTREAKLTFQEHIAIATNTEVFTTYSPNQPAVVYSSIDKLTDLHTRLRPMQHSQATPACLQLPVSSAICYTEYQMGQMIVLKAKRRALCAGVGWMV